MVAAPLRALAFGPALFLLSGCCSCFVPAEAETVVVVVPSRHDGHVGAVVATRGDQKTLLNTAYASVRMARNGEVHEAPLKPRQMEEFKKTFAAASEALPPKALTYTLYFEYGTDDPTAESNRTLDTILSEAAVRKAAEIIVVGHSDSPGTADANLALSVRRAERMRDLLVQRGAPAELIVVTGVGDTDPEVQTDVREERNRRVEITIR
jgi:outer membrane protein OmpA-like peptidoglycan-associated protein